MIEIFCVLIGLIAGYLLGVTDALHSIKHGHLEEYENVLVIDSGTTNNDSKPILFR